MIYFLIIWMILLFASSMTGLAVLELLRTSRLHCGGDRWMTSIWLGIVAIAIPLTAMAFILPLSPLAGGLMVFGLCFCSLKLKAVRYQLRQFQAQVSWQKMVIFWGAAIAVSAYMSQEVTWIDTGLYHYGAIHWLSQFGTVPGLALLIQQLGFSSSWFALSAPFNPEFLEGRASAVTNGFVLFVAILHCLVSLSYILKKQAKLSDWFSLTFFLLVLPILGFTHLLSIILVSASPDIPIVFLIGIITWVILAISNPAQPRYSLSKTTADGAELIPVLLSVGAVSIKLTALPLLLPAGLFYGFASGWHWNHNLRRLAIASIVTLSLLAPILALNVTTSGCPLYPSHFLCMDLPWSSAAQAAQDLAEQTQGGEAWFGTPPDSAHPGLWLFMQWFEGMHSSKLIVFLILASLLVSPYILRTAKTKRKPELFWLFLFAAVGIPFMMWKAPLLRLGMGYLFILPSLAIAVLLHSHSDRFNAWVFRVYSRVWHKLPIPSSAWVLCLGAVLIAVSLGKWSENPRLLLPPALPTADLVTSQINDVTYFKPQDKHGLCWATELPCAARPKQNIRFLKPNLGIRGGFTQRP